MGFWKRGTGKPSITWPQSVDEALSVGWIDGIRKSLGAEAYVIRFTPRRPGSIWSAVNVRRMHALIAEGRVLPAGRAALAAATPQKTAIYAYEQQRKTAVLDPASERALRANAAAWEHWTAQPPWYRRTVSHWVTSAKREETRARRLQALIAASAAGQAVRGLERPARRSQ